MRSVTCRRWMETFIKCVNVIKVVDCCSFRSNRGDESRSDCDWSGDGLSRENMQLRSKYFESHCSSSFRGCNKCCKVSMTHLTFFSNPLHLSQKKVLKRSARRMSEKRALHASDDSALIFMLSLRSGIVIPVSSCLIIGWSCHNIAMMKAKASERWMKQEFGHSLLVEITNHSNENQIKAINWVVHSIWTDFWQNPSEHSRNISVSLSHAGSN